MQATVVNTLPFPLTEFKPGLIPDYYEIPAADKGDISTLTISDGHHLQFIPLTDDRVPPLKMIDLGEVIAESLIRDYVSGCLGVDYTPLSNGAIPIPGLFSLRGEWDAMKVKVQKQKEIEKSVNNTIAWFERLVIIADDDWTKYHQFRFITDTQRHACKYLGLNREWNFSAFDAKNSICWACKSSVHPKAIICNQCGCVLNEKEFEANKSRFVKIS